MYNCPWYYSPSSSRALTTTDLLSAPKSHCEDAATWSVKHRGRADKYQENMKVKLFNDYGSIISILSTVVRQRWSYEIIARRREKQQKKKKKEKQNDDDSGGELLFFEILLRHRRERRREKEVMNEFSLLALLLLNTGPISLLFEERKRDCSGMFQCQWGISLVNEDHRWSADISDNDQEYPLGNDTYAASYVRSTLERKEKAFLIHRLFYFLSQIVSTANWIFWSLRRKCVWQVFEREREGKGKNRRA